MSRFCLLLLGLALLLSSSLSLVVPYRHALLQRRRPRLQPVVRTTTTLASTTTNSNKHALSTTDDEQQRTTTTFGHNKATTVVIMGPSVETKPNYESIHGPLGKYVDDIFMKIFRRRMSERMDGIDSERPYNDYRGLIELTLALNARHDDRRQVHDIAQDILRSLFPSWMPSQYAILFSKPFPEFSCRMNAWATRVAGTWLMGETEVNDVEVDGGKIGRRQGLLVKRCRFLEESGCASVCVNSCKIPTQNFFAQDMGLPLTMTPDYETFECQFSFGLTPTESGELDAKTTPCLSRCPSSGGMRLWHDGRAPSSFVESSQCSLMDNAAIVETDKPK